jgi:tungstate transport system substrate-binding protein
MMKRLLAFIGICMLSSVLGTSVQAEDKVLKMSTTTSTEASGLLNILLPAFEKDTGIKIKVIAKGTGAAIKDGEDGNVDVIFVHAVDREMKFVKDGFGTKRYPVMHNDFIILGPVADPAGIKGMKESPAALKKLAMAKAPFISRGDDSGTHTKELEVWKASGVAMADKKITMAKDGKDVEVNSKSPADSEAWYFSIGQGMGKTLTFADEKQAYTLSDRGTYIAYKFGKKPAIGLEILVEGDADLANPYGIIPVNPAKFPHVQYDMTMQFVNWLTGEPGQKLIGGFLLEGKQLFFPDVIK